MALTPFVRATQVLGQAITIVSPTLRNSLSASLVAYRWTTPGIKNTLNASYIAAQPELTIRLTQAEVYVAILRGAETRKLRAWTFTMDGHNFYVLTLGNLATYVYDKTTQQWQTWRSDALEFWRAHMGLNWDNEIVGGDFETGQLWNIDPTTILDEDPAGVETPIISYVTGFVGWRGRDFLPCFGVSLVGSVADVEYEDASVTLRMSDDMEATMLNMGTILATQGDTSWYSLGQIGTPGRIFQVEDIGFMVRIETLEFLAQEGAEQQGG